MTRRSSPVMRSSPAPQISRRRRVTAGDPALKRLLLHRVALIDRRSGDLERALRILRVLRVISGAPRLRRVVRSAAAETGKAMNIKKGQFLAPWDMGNVVDKARATGNQQIMVCERGVSFGYNTLVSDMRGLAVMRSTGCPVVFDATHSVQQPGGLGSRSGGQREHVPVLARAAVAAGISGLFMETHPDPENALSDGPNSWPLDKMKKLLSTLVELDRAVKHSGFIEQTL